VYGSQMVPVDLQLIFWFPFYIFYFSTLGALAFFLFRSKKKEEIKRAGLPKTDVITGRQKNNPHVRRENERKSLELLQIRKQPVLFFSPFFLLDICARNDVAVPATVVIATALAPANSRKTQTHYYVLESSQRHERPKR
jgi:hypothetical protein